MISWTDDFLFFRVYNTETGKLKKCLKGSSGDEGALLKVTTALRTCCVCHLMAVLSSSYTGRIVLRCDWLISGTVLRSTWIHRGRSSPPAAPTKTSPSLTTSQESVSPPCSDTRVRKSNDLCLCRSLLRWKSLCLVYEVNDQCFLLFPFSESFKISFHPNWDFWTF